MSLYGNLPDEYKELVEALKAHEKVVDKGPFTNRQKAFHYVCMAHDWASIDLEECAYDLLKRAEITCPGYFKVHQPEDMKLNVDYAVLVIRLAAILQPLLPELTCDL